MLGCLRGTTIGRPPPQRDTNCKKTDVQCTPLQKMPLEPRRRYKQKQTVGATIGRPHIHAMRDDIQPAVDDILAFGEMICHCRAMDTNNIVVWVGRGLAPAEKSVTCAGEPAEAIVMPSCLREKMQNTPHPAFALISFFVK